MFYVDFNKAEKLLKIKLTHIFDEKDAEQWLAQIKVCLKNVQPGFKILTDLTSVERVDAATIQYIEQAMDFCNQKGVSKIVRIIPDSAKDVGFNIMSIFHYDNNIDIITVSNMDEAINRLFFKHKSF